MESQMVKQLLLLTCLTISQTGLANTITCEIDSYGPSFKKVAWNTETKGAFGMFSTNRGIAGKVVFEEEHNDSTATNIRFEIPEGLYGIHRADMRIYPIGDKQWKIMAVGFSNRDGKMILRQTYGNNNARCVQSI